MTSASTPTIALSKRPRRILLVSVTPFIGGGEIYLIKLARMLSRHYDIRVLAWQQELLSIVRDAGIHTEAISRRHQTTAGRYVSAAAALRQTLRHWQPEIVHLNGQGESHLTALPRAFGVPAITTRHTPFSAPMVSSMMQKLVLAEYSALDAVVCISAMVVRQLAAKMDSRKLHLIPNWIESGAVYAALPPKQNHASLQLLVVSRLVPAKGVMDVVHAISHLPGVSLDIVGDGPQRAEIEAAAAGLPVRLLGHQNNCAPFYQAADLVVFPSAMEGQGLVPLESMAQGTPCLVSDIEPALETVDHGSCAAVFRQGDIQDLVRQISRLQRDPLRMEALRQAGLDRVRTHYSEAAIEPRFLTLYEDIIRKRREARKSGGKD